ncbi:MAG: type II secretion system F family protein [Pseudomonadota bacterium]
MDLSFLTSLLESKIDLEQSLFFSIIIAISTFLFSLAILLLVSSFLSPTKRHIRQLLKTGQYSEYADKEAITLTREYNDKINRVIDPVSKYFLPQKDKERVKINMLLRYAGYPSRDALKIFYSLKAFLMIFFPLIILVSLNFFEAISLQTLLILLMAGAALGLIFPNFVLKSMANSRQRRLRIGFPDALDILVVCVEAGLGLEASLQRVTQSMDLAHPDLAQELSLVNGEIRLGISIQHALRNLMHRTGIKELSGFITVIDQSTRLGTPIGQSLRVYASEFRDRRRQAAEEMAAKLGLKLIFPTVLCMWPGFFVVVVGPTVIKAMSILQ